jgi:hypothetical protein
LGVLGDFLLDREKNKQVKQNGMIEIKIDIVPISNSAINLSKIY